MPDVREASGPLREAAALSSRLLDLLPIGGEVTGSGPLLDLCGVCAARAARDHGHARAAAEADVAEAAAGDREEPRSPEQQARVAPPPAPHLVRHSWSLWGPTDCELLTVWRQLEHDLTGTGWTILQRDTQPHIGRIPSLLADAPQWKFTVRITLELVPHHRPPARGEASGIRFSLVSACFREPEQGLP